MVATRLRRCAPARSGVAGGEQDPRRRGSLPETGEHGLIDSHCHLGHIEGEAADVLAEARGAGVHAVVDIGMGTVESRASAERAVSLEGVYAAVGVHPNDLAEFEADPDGTMATLRSLATRPRVVGIGETGLDFYRDRAARELQEEAFRAHIRLARETGHTLVVHCRDAHDRVLAVLDEAGPVDRVIMHCFSGDAAYAMQCADRGFFCSFAGNVTYKRNTDLRRAATSVPTKLLLVETDAPFLAPEPHRGRPNRPALLPATATKLASVLDMPLREFETLLDDNTRRAFSL